MSEREAYIDQMKAKLDQWNDEIGVLEAKAKVAGADAKVKYEEYLSTLKEKQADASARLAELRDSSGDAWQEIRHGASQAADALGEALKSAKSKLH
ncbi:hypothetical protein ThidrDRAFT_2428 [Thiorhodococcus drewsii AZ1]|uniref:Coiled coil domain-containing protein n=1 Tax=Thiorhodococcus drewsii AZ1 TaxID=765913 RepID=G2E2J6_9GAMM|nr:hypothetical protein [Thiorhodococcus drewsii]EGV30796.1 hypothetical protein ThidrDRAFT_2428 [Thiorhodococcus drewsii AZ1]